MMESEKLPVEIEVSPRFEIFYALHKLFAPASAATEQWRKSARNRLGSRFLDEASEIAPQPLMWAILADSTLGANRIPSFDDLVAAIEATSPAEFGLTIIGAVPAIPGSDLAATFETLLHDPADYRRQLVVVLRTFWTRVFADDFAEVRPELERMARKHSSAKTQATVSNAAERFGIPLALDDSSEELLAGRSGYSIPLTRVGRIVILPSAFNLQKWWTKRDAVGGPVDFYFPLNDGTVGPNDAVSRSRAAEPATRAASNFGNLRPELVFRALGDTTRYAIATILARAPTTPSDLSRQLKVSKPTITHHVHALRDAGLIVDGEEDTRLTLDRSQLEQLSAAAVAALFTSEGKLKLSKTRKKVR